MHERTRSRSGEGNPRRKREGKQGAAEARLTRADGGRGVEPERRGDSGRAVHYGVLATENDLAWRPGVHSEVHSGCGHRRAETEREKDWREEGCESGIPRSGKQCKRTGTALQQQRCGGNPTHFVAPAHILAGPRPYRNLALTGPGVELPGAEVLRALDTFPGICRPVFVLLFFPVGIPPFPDGFLFLRNSLAGEILWDSRAIIL
jgi:hypothetical protein